MQNRKSQYLLKLSSAIFMTFALISPPLIAQNTLTQKGFPDPQMTQQAIDEADLQRAVVAYRFWYPTVSAEGIFQGNRRVGIRDNNAIPILSAKPLHVGFTLNSDTPYGGGTLDLTEGPYVVELPAGPYVALANDHHQDWILDMGIPGPDKGKGGKYIILPPGYKDEAPSGFMGVGYAKTNKIILAFRALPQHGDAKAALESLRQIKIYPYSSANKPKLINFVDANETKMDMTLLSWETNLKYWEELSKIINSEPIAEEFLPMYGLLSTLGIEKGKPFAPDERMKSILEKAAVVGHEQMLVSAFASNREDRLTWLDRKWEWVGLIKDNGAFKTAGGGIDLEARDRWFAQAIASSPAMFRREAGGGSLYWLGLKDREGAYLEGGNNYKLQIPQPVPANLFWSITLYDAKTRSEVQTPQNKAALRSLFELNNLKEGGPIELYFGPTAPAGKEDLWIQTTPGKNWFAYFRIYGPTDAAFNGSWKLGDFEKLKI